MEENDKKTKGKGSKALKGILIALGSLIVILVLLAAFSPLILQTFINSETGNKKVNEIASEYLNANVDFKKIKLKVWKNMPDIELELINSEIISKAITDDLTDTLLKFDTLRVSVNIMEFIKNDSIIINEAYLSHPIINAYTNIEGKSNWEIYESDTTPDDDTSSFDYKIRLNRLFIEDLQATYYDESSLMRASLDSTDIEMHGEMTSEILNLATKLKINADYDDGSSNICAKIYPSEINLDGNMEKGDYNLTTKFGQIAAKFSDSTSCTNMTVDSIGIEALAKLSDSIYDINTNLNILLSEYADSTLKFSDIPLSINLKGKANANLDQFDIDTLHLNCTDIFIGASGLLQNKADSSWNTDIALALDIPHLDKTLEMIPPSLVSELKKYKISGSINFNGTAKGTYKDDIYPDIEANIALNNIRAIVLEQNAEVKLDMESDLRYSSENQCDSYINVKRLNATVGETYFDLKGKASNILGDPYINAKLQCNLNLDYIAKLFPIEDITYNGKLSSDIEAKFSLNNLMKMNLPQIYMLGNINIERILLRIPSMKLFVFGKNATADLGINSMKSRRSERLQLSSARIAVDTVRITSPRTFEARVSKLNLYANVEEPINDVPHLIVAGSLRGMQAIVADTMFVSGKTGRISMSIRPDTTDALIPALRASLGLDSIVYYEPTMGAFLDSTRIVLNGRPRVRRFTRVNGERVEIDQSTRKSIDTDSLISLCTGIEDAETALKRFRFDGKIYAKTARYMSPYFELKTSTRRLDITFTDDTLHLNNFMLRVGRSLLKVNGRVDNMRRAFLRGRTLSADLNIQSRNLDLNEILYANHNGEQAKIRDDEAKKTVQERLSRAKTGMGNAPQRPSNITDSARAHYVDSIRKAYSKKDLSEIYNERMGKMKEMMEKAHNEELANADDTEIQDTTEPEYDTVPMSLIEIPENLNCKINLKLDTVKFAGLKMNNLNGDITAQNSTLSVRDMSTSSNVGDLKLSATYKCNNPDTAKAGIDLFGTNITVEDLLSAFPIIDSILPMLSSFEGKLDCELSAITDLDKEMEPILPTLQTACHINGKNLVLLDGETFTTVAKYLMFKKKTKNVIDKMSVEFTIDNNVLSVYPFTISMDKYKVAVSGKMDFDFKYFFHISVLEPKTLPNLGINVQTKEPKKNKKNKDKDKDENEEGELVEESDDFQFRLVKPLYKDEKSIAQSINLVNKAGVGRISLQQNLRKTIQNIIENYDEKKEQ